LLYLIRLCFCALTLEINLLFDPRLTENVMAPAGAFCEAKREQQSAQIFEANICIALATDDLVEGSIVSSQGPAE